MNNEEFKKLVKKMRQEQKDFFMTRNVNHLNKARKLEQKVDEVLWPKPPDTQKRMRW